MPASPIRAVVFDFFGTLTHAVSRGAEHERVAVALGVDPVALGDVLSETFYERATGKLGSLPDTMRDLADRLGAAPTDSDIAEACTARLAVLAHDARLRSDAVPTLVELRARGLRTALVSDCTHELPEIWPTLAPAEHIEAAVFSFLSGVCKPDPSMYERAYTALAVTPDECLYVGDGGSHELTGARAAGMHAVQLVAPDSAEHLSYGVDDWDGPTIGSLAEILDLVG